METCAYNVRWYDIFHLNKSSLIFYVLAFFSEYNIYHKFLYAAKED